MGPIWLYTELRPLFKALQWEINDDVVYSLKLYSHMGRIKALWPMETVPELQKQKLVMKDWRSYYCFDILQISMTLPSEHFSW